MATSEHAKGQAGNSSIYFFDIIKAACFKKGMGKGWSGEKEEKKDKRLRGQGLHPPWLVAGRKKRNTERKKNALCRKVSNIQRAKGQRV